MKYVILDNGHGYNTPGKCSPLKEDGTRYYEWKFTRQLKKRIVDLFKNDKDIDTFDLVPGDDDMSLSRRANKANVFIADKGAKNTILISIHSNAAAGSGWTTARGYSVWTTRGNNNSDKLAECIINKAEKYLAEDELYDAPKPVRTDKSDGDKDYEANFYIIKRTDTACCLVENLFHNNKKDVEYLESEHGQEVLAKIIYEGTKDYFKIKG